MTDAAEELPEHYRKALAENRGMAAYKSMSQVERMKVVAAAPELLNALWQLVLYDFLACQREGCRGPQELDAAIDALHKVIPFKRWGYGFMAPHPDDDF
jgi:hypothetical protein